MTENPPTPPPPRNRVHFDWTEWLPEIAELDATDAQKRALIETTWLIITSFIDMHWEVGAVPSTSQETCGQVPGLAALLRAAVLDLKKHHKNTQEEV